MPLGSLSHKEGDLAAPELVQCKRWDEKVCEDGPDCVQVQFTLLQRFQSGITTYDVTPQTTLGMLAKLC